MGLTIELPLPLLEDFLLLPCRSLARWKFIKLLTAGDCPVQPLPGLASGIVPKGAAILLTCGFVRIESSMSPASIRSSSSEVLPEELDPIILPPPREFKTATRSGWARV